MESSRAAPMPEGAGNGMPPAPVESAYWTRTSSDVPLPGTYWPTACVRPRSPPAVGTSALEPATRSGM